MLTRIALAAAAALLFVSGAALAEDPVKARKDGFDANKKAMGEIKALLDGSALDPVAGVAQRVGAFATRIPSLFPAGSDKGETKAKPEIWADFGDFSNKAKAFETAAKELETAAAAGDKAAARQSFAALGGTCKACHDRYRAN